MTVKAITPRDWLAFEEWRLEHLNLFEFSQKFLTDAEKAELSERRETTELRLVLNEQDGTIRSIGESAPEPEPSDEEWKQLLDDMEQQEQWEQDELLALANRLGCNIYLAGYLRHINAKLDIIARVFSEGKVTMRGPVTPKKRRKHA